jgi:hypothetical protein
VVLRVSLLLVTDQVLLGLNLDIDVCHCQGEETLQFQKEVLAFQFHLIFCLYTIVLKLRFQV